MTPLLARANILKLREHPKRRGRLHIALGVLEPATQPSLLIRLEVARGEVPPGIHVAGGDLDFFEYLPICRADGSPFAQGRCCELVLKVDLRLDDDGRRVVTLIENGKIFHHVAEVLHSAGRVRVNVLDPERAERVDLLAEGSENHVPLFIGGAPKSGTTWVEKIFNAHPQCLMTGENGFWDWPLREGLENGSLVIGDSMATIRNATVTQWPLSNVNGMAGYGRARLTLRQLAAISGLRHVGDKTPSNARVAEDVMRLFPSGHYIHCLRDPLDVLVSRAFHEALVLRRAAKENTGMAGMVAWAEGLDLSLATEDSARMLLGDPRFRDDILTEWCAYNASAERARTQGGSVHMVHYGALLANPRVEMARLFDAVGLEHSPQLLNRIMRETRFSAMSGGRLPGQQDASSFFRKGVVSDCRNYFGDDEIARLRAELRARAGYDRG